VRTSDQSKTPSTGSGSRPESPGIKKNPIIDKPNPYQYKSPYMNNQANNIINPKPSTPSSSGNSGSNSRHINDPNSVKKPTSSKQQIIVPSHNKVVVNNPYGNHVGNNNILQKPNILNQPSHNHQIIRSDNKNPLIKPNVYDNKNVVRPNNNYGADYKSPVVKPSSNYDNKPVLKPANNYHYNYGGAQAGQPSSNQANQNRFLQAVRPSSGVNKVVKR
jgi:hypothetical protein